MCDSQRNRFRWASTKVALTTQKPRGMIRGEVLWKFDEDRWEFDEVRWKLRPLEFYESCPLQMDSPIEVRRKFNEVRWKFDAIRWSLMTSVGI